jgi:ferredoxin
VEAIHPTAEETKGGSYQRVYIDPVECIDCGACVAECPVDAIFHADELPRKWRVHQQINHDYFDRYPDQKYLPSHSIDNQLPPEPPYISKPRQQ